jgi:carboxyl-terminal processing protease
MQKLFSKIGFKGLLLATVIALSSFGIIKYRIDKNDIIVNALLGTLSDYHYAAVNIDDAFSEKVYDLYIKHLDGSKKFFLQEDIDQLDKYRHSIDDELNTHHHEFYKKAVDIITQRIQEKRNWAAEYLSKPIDLTADEEYDFDTKNTSYSKTQDELKKQWQKMLKYQVLARIDDAMERQDKAIEKKDTTVKIRPFDSIEADARRKTLKSNKNLFKSYDKITARERFSQFANAVTGVYDPHTEYFAPKEKQKFNEMMSGQFEGIGARLSQNDDGSLKVSEVMMGSPSYKQGDLKAGDEILKVAQGSNPPVDITVMEMENAIELIKGKKGTEVRLTVRKATDKSIKVIPIVRDVVEMEETFAKSAILENKNKIGYIYLPTFYTPFSNNGQRHCAQDMRKEIEKLKAQNVKGLIIDLRDNGGGSLSEVIDMAGLFFTRGPVVQVKGKNNTISIYEDKNPDVAWDGPLTILVNHNSASASEILAAAIQDYKRGVIVGTPSFGKGTVQSFYDLDYALLPQFDTIKPAGQVKITNQKFYRISGGATQIKGVIPDVLLPDPYGMIDEGEKQLDNPMPWDEISRANYVEFNNINYPALVKNSQARVKKNSQWTLVEQQEKENKSRKDDTKYNLNYEKFRAEQKQYRDQNKKYEDLRKEIKGFNAYLLDVDKARLASDTSRASREDRWTKNITKDIYIHEATNVLNDMVK